MADQGKQTKRKRATRKTAAAAKEAAAPVKPDVPDDEFNEEAEKWDEDKVESIIKDIKSEIDDQEFYEENSSNFMVELDSLKEEPFIEGYEDSSNSQGVAATSTKKGKKPAVAKGKKKAAKKPNKSDKGESSNDVLENSMSDSEFSSEDSESSDGEMDSDMGESSNDVTAEGFTGDASAPLPRPVRESRYPFKLSESDYLKFTQAMFKSNLGATEAESSQSQPEDENGEGPAKKPKLESEETNGETAEPEAEVDFETIHKQRLERLEKLNQAVGFIKEVLAKLAEKENAKKSTEDTGTIVEIKSEVVEEKCGILGAEGEIEQVAIKEEKEDLPMDVVPKEEVST